MLLRRGDTLPRVLDTGAGVGFDIDATARRTGRRDGRELRVGEADVAVIIGRAGEAVFAESTRR